jgi:hypothetical protein
MVVVVTAEDHCLEENRRFIVIPAVIDPEEYRRHDGISNHSTPNTTGLLRPPLRPRLHSDRYGSFFSVEDVEFLSHFIHTLSRCFYTVQCTVYGTSLRCVVFAILAFLYALCFGDNKAAIQSVYC